MKRMLRAVALLAVAASARSGWAQAPVPPERPRDVEAPAASRQDRPELQPDQIKLERLAQLIGTLAFLRDLCPPGDGDVWRGKMQDLLAAEGVTPARRDRLAGAFNRGFDSYRVAHRHCTPAAGLVIERALGEGADLAHDLSARFGG